MADRVRVRASGLAEVADCAKRWYAKNILRLTTASSIFALLGTSFHAATALWDEANMNGYPIEPGQAADLLVEKLTNPDQEVRVDPTEMTVNEAIGVGLRMFSVYVEKIAPNYEFVAVEREVKPMDVDCGDGVILTLTGTLDRARIVKASGGGKGIADIKTGSRAIEKGRAKTAGHAPQLGMYELLEEYTTGEACTEDAEIIAIQSNAKAEHATGLIKNAREAVIGGEDRTGLLDVVALYLKHDVWPANPKSMLCSPKFCSYWSRCKAR